MNGGQIAKHQGVVESDWEGGKPVDVQQGKERFGTAKPLLRLFDDDFLDTDRADVNRVPRVGDLDSRRIGNERWIVEPPQQDVRIEQKLHSSPP